MPTVPRTGETVDPGDRFGAIGQSTDGPGAAHFVNGIHAGFFSSHEKLWGDISRGGRRSSHDHLGHTGDFGRDGAHEHRGDQGGGAALAARYVYAGGIHGIDHLAQEGAGTPGVDPRFRQLLAVKGFDLGGRTIQRTHEGPINLLAGRRHLFRGDSQILLGHFRSIELPGVADQGAVPVLPDILDDPGDGLDVFLPEVDLPSDDGLEFLLRRGRVVKYFHGTFPFQEESDTSLTEVTTIPT